MATQDQALMTNVIKKRIDKNQEDRKYRMCMEEDETITHIIHQCGKLAQRENKIRHDNVVRALHW